MSTHACPVDRCVVQVQDHQLMCRKHWKMVPYDLQQPVYRTWRDGEGYGTKEHAVAMRNAITAVNDELARR